MAKRAKTAKAKKGAKPTQQTMKANGKPPLREGTKGGAVWAFISKRLTGKDSASGCSPRPTGAPTVA